MNEFNTWSETYRIAALRLSEIEHYQGKDSDAYRDGDAELRAIKANRPGRPMAAAKPLPWLTTIKTDKDIPIPPQVLQRRRLAGPIK